MPQEFELIKFQKLKRMDNKSKILISLPSDRPFLSYLRRKLGFGSSGGSSLYPSESQNNKRKVEFFTDFLSPSPFDSFWTSTISSGTVTI